MKNLFKKLLVILAAVGLTGCSFKIPFISNLSNKQESSEVEKPSEEKPEEQPPVEADPVLVSISVSGQFKSEYEVGEEFSSEGIVVTAHFDKGEDKDVSSEASFSGFDSSVAGECVVTVSFSGKSAEISLTIVEAAKEQAQLPVKEILAFFGDIEVVIPSFECANTNVVYEIDDSYEGYFDVYVTGATHEEMDAFKDALVGEGWSVIGESDGDFRLQFGETSAFVDLVDFGDYLCFSFYVYEAPEGLSPEEAVTDIASWFGGSVSEVQEGVFGTYGAFPAASYSVEDMKGYVSSLFVPEEFELVNDWAEEAGTHSCMYANSVLTVLEIYVYAETLYVDGDGYIVDEGTEGATAVEATCIEVYAYTYSE